jgi:hypothetical protein
MLQYSPLPVASPPLDLQPVYACHQRNHCVLLLRFITVFYYCVLLHSPLACGTRSCVRISNAPPACTRRKITTFYYCVLLLRFTTEAFSNAQLLPYL